MVVEEAQPSILEDLSPSKIVTRMLSELMPQDEVAEHESGCKDEPSDALTKVLQKNVEEGLVDESIEQPIEQPTIHIEERMFK